MPEKMVAVGWQRLEEADPQAVFPAFLHCPARSHQGSISPTSNSSSSPHSRDFPEASKETRSHLNQQDTLTTLLQDTPFSVLNAQSPWLCPSAPAWLYALSVLH